MYFKALSLTSNCFQCDLVVVMTFIQLIQRKHPIVVGGGMFFSSQVSFNVKRNSEIDARTMIIFIPALMAESCMC